MDSGRSAGRGWALLGLDVVDRLIDTGQATANLVAAMPSLHAAHAALVPALFWRGRAWTVRLGLLAYPTAMGFVLVATGEHYVINLLAGFALVAAVCWACRRWEARHEIQPSVDAATNPARNPRQPTQPHPSRRPGPTRQGLDRASSPSTEAPPSNSAEG